MRLIAVAGGNEVTNPFMVTEVYVQAGATPKLASLSFTRLITPGRPIDAANSMTNEIQMQGQPVKVTTSYSDYRKTETV